MEQQNLPLEFEHKDPLQQETEDILPIVLKNSMNAHKFPVQGEINFEPSQTLPDQSMSIKEIMDRYARGLPIEGAKVPMYEGEEGDFADLSKMDLAEREEYIEAKKQELEELNQKLANERDVYRKAQQEKKDLEEKEQADLLAMKEDFKKRKENQA